MNLCNNGPEGVCTVAEPLVAHKIVYFADVTCVSGQVRNVLPNQGKNTQTLQVF